MNDEVDEEHDFSKESSSLWADACIVKSRPAAELARGIRETEAGDEVERVSQKQRGYWPSEIPFAPRFGKRAGTHPWRMS